MPVRPEPLVITDLRGGMNVEASPMSLPNDQVVLAENMDFSRGTLGGRRLGHAQVVASGNNTYTFMYRYLPDQEPDSSRLLLYDVGTAGGFQYWDNSGFSMTGDTGSEALDATRGLYAIAAQELHGKVFLAYPTVSGTDRLHVFDADGSEIRRTGLAEPAAPSVANQGSGSLTGARSYRVRYTVQSGGVTLRRSEPSTATAITPSGSGAAVRVTKPATISEGETHWEIEASVDGTLFYVIATVAVGTTTYDDTSTTSDITEDSTRLSPDIGDYALQYNPKFLSADNDRLLMAGSWEQPQLESRVSWTPVFAGPGAGNDERLEEDTDPFLDLDGQSGGGITAFAGPINGYHYAFKRKRIYKLIRTYARAQAYQALPVTDAFGALPRSTIKGVDPSGRACLYFLDPDLGPCRITVQGIERCGNDIFPLWKTVNKDADLVGHGVFYADKMQVMWDVATNGANTPNLRIKLQIDQQTQDRYGARRGWSTDTGPYVATLASEMYSDPPRTATRTQDLKPLFAVDNRVDTSLAPAVQFDRGTSDATLGYQGLIRTKPYLPAGLFNQFKIRSATIAAEASEADVRVTLVRDYGKETKAVDISLRPSEDGETNIVRQMDDAELSELRTLQVEIGDAAPTTVDWVLEAIGFIPESGLPQ